MRDFIDDIFEALYGTSWCGDTNETYSEYYSFESRGMLYDIVEKTTTLLESRFDVGSLDVAKIIYLSEDSNIGNKKRQS